MGMATGIPMPTVDPDPIVGEDKVGFFWVFAYPSPVFFGWRSFEARGAFFGLSSNLILEPFIEFGHANLTLLPEPKFVAPPCEALAHGRRDGEQ
jgi:hypothetical protein